MRGIIGLFVAVAIGLAGCSGSGRTPPPNATKLTVSGTASEGALIVGRTVKLKDVNGKSAVNVTTNATTGVYSFDVTDLTAPFLLTTTGTNETYLSLAQTDGTTNINPITTMVVVLAGGNSDTASLFTNLTPTQLAAINTNYAAKSALVTASLQTVLATGITAQSYFTGSVTAGTGMDALFDAYQISAHPTNGITVQTKGTSITTVLTIPAATVAANSTQSLPVIILNATPLSNAGVTQFAIAGTLVTLDGSSSNDANGDTLTYSWSFTSKPSGSVAALSSTTVVTPTFTPDFAGAYSLTLVVNDGMVNSTAATVTVEVTSDVSGRHPDGWVATGTGGTHTTASEFGKCLDCHGSDLKGGIAQVSCFSQERSGISCHSAGPATVSFPVK